MDMHVHDSTVNWLTQICLKNCLRIYSCVTKYPCTSYSVRKNEENHDLLAKCKQQLLLCDLTVDKKLLQQSKNYNYKHYFVCHFFIYQCINLALILSVQTFSLLPSGFAKK